MEDHQKIQIPFELNGQDVTLVGFWSNQHQGVFTPMGTNMHAHFQTLDNKVSGHVQGLKLAHDMTLGLPKGWWAILTARAWSDCSDASRCTLARL
jgi:acetolactate decarboxylase